MLAVIANSEQADGHLIRNFRGSHPFVHERQDLGLPVCEGLVPGIRLGVIDPDAFRSLWFWATQMNESIFSRSIQQHHRADAEILASPDTGFEIDLESIGRFVIECGCTDRTALAAKLIAENILAG